MIVWKVWRIADLRDYLIFQNTFFLKNNLYFFYFMITSSLTELIAFANECKKNSQTIAWTNGCFDIIHPGHLQTFAEAKKLADVVIVGLNADASPYFLNKPGRPINNEDFRANMLLGLKNVDCVYIFNRETPIEPIGAILPNFLLKGGDYKAEEIVGYQEVV